MYGPFRDEHRPRITVALIRRRNQFPGEVAEFSLERKLFTGRETAPFPKKVLVPVYGIYTSFNISTSIREKRRPLSRIRPPCSRNSREKVSVVVATFDDVISRQRLVAGVGARRGWRGGNLRGPADESRGEGIFTLRKNNARRDENIELMQLPAKGRRWRPVGNIMQPLRVKGRGALFSWTVDLQKLRFFVELRLIHRNGIRYIRINSRNA